MAFFPFFDRFPDKQALIRTQQSHLMGLCYFCMHLLNKGLQLCADKILQLDITDLSSSLQTAVVAAIIFCLVLLLLRQHNGGRRTQGTTSICCAVSHK